jgi:hypothetical protein
VSSVKKKQKGIQVSKVEVSDNKAKFLVAKGLVKKRWIVVREIPILEIEHIDKFGNELSVTWKGNSDSFFTKGKTDLFGKLVNQINGMLEDDQQKSKENNEKDEKAALKRNELLAVINTSVGIIDQSFNILIGFQEKRINWQRLEGYSSNFGENINFTWETMPPLSLEFTKISSAIKSQLPKEISNEAYNILNSVYGYFKDLKVDDDPKENHPNFHDAKAVILAYFMLNDLLLGKVVGDKDNREEDSQLETIIQNLATETNFKLSIDQLRSTINEIDINSNLGSVIESSREIFKNQLKQQLKPTVESLASPQHSNKGEVSTEPVHKDEVSTEPVHKDEVSTEPVHKDEVSTEPVHKDEVSTEPVHKDEAQPANEASVPPGSDP